MIQPFSITSDSIQLVKDTGENCTKLNFIDLSTGVTTPAIAITPLGEYNAIGLNVLDKYLYGYDLENHQIVKIGVDSTPSEYPYVASSREVENLPVANFDAGDVDNTGHFYLYPKGNPNFYVVDLTDASKPTEVIPLQTILNILDWVISPSTSNLHTLDASGTYYEINPNNGQLITQKENLVPSCTTGYGACFADNKGNIYTTNSDTGTIYKVNTVGDPQATELVMDTGNIAVNGARFATSSIDLLSVDKVPTVSQASKGLAFAYFTTITNNSSSFTATSATFLDQISEYMNFTPNSVIVGNNYAYGSNPNDGIAIGDIAPNQSLIVSFDVQAITTIPDSVTTLVNTASVEYSEEGTTQTLTAEDTATLPLLGNKLVIFKTADKLISTVGDMIQYHVTLQNLTGEVQSISSFYDYFPAGTKYVKGTLKVNGELDESAIVDFPLGEAAAVMGYELNNNETTTFDFQVRVLSSAVRLGQISNDAGMTYGETGQDFESSGRAITEVPSIGRGILFIE